MKVGSSRLVGFLLAASVCILQAASIQAQEVPAAVRIPEKFRLDMETAARMRPQLRAASVSPSEHYVIGRTVFDRLVQQAHPPEGLRVAWELRIIEDGQFNAYSSPDGSVYVESGLAQLAGSSAGLWAAILSHEIAHVARRDWARRYIYEQSLRKSGGGIIILGDPGLSADGWIDSKKASEDLAEFCRRMEVDADRESLMLMARTGFHPDFVPALHHLMHAQSASGSGTEAGSIDVMHPCWEERDRELQQAYVRAGINFEHVWPEWYASPGGNPPIVVFTESPIVRKNGSQQWEIQAPMRCQNLTGAVEVVLRRRPDPNRATTYVDEQDMLKSSAPDNEIRQLTGCTSLPKTTITFTLGKDSALRAREPWSDVYVLDADGAVLARAEIHSAPR